MGAAKVFIFAPADPTGESHRKLEGRGWDLVLGKASWDTPQGNNEEEMAEMATGCDALTGTSIRSSPITKKIMQSSNKLRIVAKYTIGVDDVDVDAATELGIVVTHSPTESNWGRRGGRHHHRNANPAQESSRAGSALEGRRPVEAEGVRRDLRWFPRRRLPGDHHRADWSW